MRLAERDRYGRPRRKARRRFRSGQGPSLWLDVRKGAFQGPFFRLDARRGAIQGPFFRHEAGAGPFQGLEKALDVRRGAFQGLINGIDARIGAFLGGDEAGLGRRIASSPGDRSILRGS